MPTLIEAVLNAPLVGHVPGEHLLHAVILHVIVRGWEEAGSVQAACGAEGVKLMQVEDELVPWPPQARGMKPFVRCRLCWIATGQHRPRCKIHL